MQNISDFENKRRLTMATCDYLNNNVPLKDIAAKYGYESEEQLANDFYEYQNVSIYKAKSTPTVLKFTPLVTATG